MADLLIIDDDTTGAAALARLLRNEGHTADWAASAGEALTSLRRKEPDLVLLDLTMPRTDGLDLLDALAEDPRFSAVRVAVYTGRNEPESLEAAKRLGACDYIPKGQDWDMLYGRIKVLLEKTSADC